MRQCCDCRVVLPRLSDPVECVWRRGWWFGQHVREDDVRRAGTCEAHVQRAGLTLCLQEDDEPGKRTAVSGTEKEELEADDIAKPAKPAKPEGFRKPAAYDEPIRKRKQETKQEEEDDNFADEMIEEARRKRQSKVTEAEAKPKKQRKKAKAEQGE